MMVDKSFGQYIKHIYYSEKQGSFGNYLIADWFTFPSSNF